MALIMLDERDTLYARVFSFMYNHLALKGMSLYKAMRIADMVAYPFLYIDKLLEKLHIIEVIE